MKFKNLNLKVYCISDYGLVLSHLNKEETLSWYVDKYGDDVIAYDVNSLNEEEKIKTFSEFLNYECSEVDIDNNNYIFYDNEDDYYKGNKNKASSLKEVIYSYLTKEPYTEPIDFMFE